MTDGFALFGETRRPWLDPEALKAKFHTLSAEVHPDHVHSSSAAAIAAANERFALLNAAYRRLRDPKERVLHLLLLESGAKPADVGRIPPGTIDLFQEVGQACRAVDALIEERAKSESPMRRVQSFERGLEWTDRLDVLLRRTLAWQDALAAELGAMNPRWESAPPVGRPDRATSLPLRRLEEIHQLLGYLTRWTDQLRERQTRLAL